MSTEVMLSLRPFRFLYVTLLASIGFAAFGWAGAVLVGLASVDAKLRERR